MTIKRRGHNNPPVVLELPEALARFVLDNSLANIEQGLSFLQMIKSEDLARKLVDNIENFKELKKLCEEALKDRR